MPCHAMLGGLLLRGAAGEAKLSGEQLFGEGGEGEQKVLNWAEREARPY